MKLDSISLNRTEQSAKLDDIYTESKEYFVSMNTLTEVVTKAMKIALLILAIIAAKVVLLPVLLVFITVMLPLMISRKFAALKRLIETQVFIFFYFLV